MSQQNVPRQLSPRERQALAELERRLTLAEPRLAELLERHRAPLPRIAGLALMASAHAAGALIVLASLLGGAGLALSVGLSLGITVLASTAFLAPERLPQWKGPARNGTR